MCYSTYRVRTVYGVREGMRDITTDRSMPLARCLRVMTTRRRSPSSISLSNLWTTPCMVRGSIAGTIAGRLPGGYAERNLKLALEYGWMVEIQFLLIMRRPIRRLPRNASGVKPNSNAYFLLRSQILCHVDNIVGPLSKLFVAYRTLKSGLMRSHTCHCREPHV